MENARQTRQPGAARQRQPRACGPCSACCTTLDVGPPINSLRNTRCAHDGAGTGCAIYATRPDVCRAFACLWLEEADAEGRVLRDEERPDLCGLFLAAIGPTSLSVGGRTHEVEPLVAHEVTPGDSERWRGRKVLARVSKRRVVILARELRMIGRVAGVPLDLSVREGAW